MSIETTAARDAERAFCPVHRTRPVPRHLRRRLRAGAGLRDSKATGPPSCTGVALDSRAIRPGDLYAAVPVANRYGA